jgi:hypothetical protein
MFNFVRAQFNYERGVEPVVNAGWHQIQIPNTVLAKLNDGFRDIRLFSANGQEIPYLLRTALDDVKQSSISLQPFNVSKQGGDLYFTIKVDKNELINRATILLNPGNYDCNITLAGSHNEKEWFVVTDSLRIISIADNNILYESSSIRWPDIRYSFVRFSISNTAKHTLRSVRFSQLNIVRGDYERSTLTPIVRQLNKVTQFDFEMDETSYASTLKINLIKGQQFYRSFMLEGAVDSTNTEKGWVQNYSQLSAGVLASFSSDSIAFKPTMIKKFRLTVYNQDNPPISLPSITTFSPKVNLVARIEPAEYMIRYGDPTLAAPNYDLAHFANEVPATLASLKLQEEKALGSTEKTQSVPWFKNKNWLWAAMLLLVGLLGYFTLTMIRKA